MIVGQRTSQKLNRRPTAFTSGLVALAVLGCQASVQGRASTASSGPAEPDPFARLDEPGQAGSGDGEAGLAELDAQLTSGPSAPALLGARHDVGLAPGVTPTCSCMSFAVGEPSDARFVWEGQHPALAQEDSVVAAFAMVDGECSSEHVASYRGYQLVGNDVHVLVEQAVEGRPHLFGAIVPRPQPGGSFVIVPPAEAPFGHSRKPTDTRCVLAEGSTPPNATTPTNAPHAVSASDPNEQRHFRRVDARGPDNEEVPSAEEFGETPSDIPLDGPPHSPRDGFHLSMLLGAEYLMADVNVDSDLSTHQASGLGLGFDVYIGGNPRPNIALGLMLGGSSVPDPKLDIGGESDAQTVSEQRSWQLDGSTLTLSGTQMNLFRVGAFADYYFSPDSNWHGSLMLGYANLSFSGSEIPDSLQGFASQLGLGYDFWLSYHWSLGIVARLVWSPMSSSVSDSTVHLLSPSLALGLTFH